jgi:hypothetical protein
VGEREEPRTGERREGRLEEADWAINAFGGALLGDKRRTDRPVAVASVLGQRPAASIPAACDEPAMHKGAYRLFEGAATTPAAILTRHVEATWERVGAAGLAPAVRDTTELDLSAHPAPRGLGPVGRGGEAGLYELFAAPRPARVGLLVRAVPSGRGPLGWGCSGTAGS